MGLIVRLVLVTLVSVQLTGCASMIMKGYVGQSLLSVVEDYGTPTSAYDTGREQERAFIWVMGSTYVSPQVSRTNVGVVGNQLYGSTVTAPATVSTSRCSYVIYAKRTRMDIEGPAAWTVVDFKRPSLMCE